jgi:hypothetical protein
MKELSNLEEEKNADKFEVHRGRQDTHVEKDGE